MVLPDAIDLRHGLLCLIDFPMAEIEARRLGKEQDAEAQDGGPDKGQTHSDAPRGGFAGLVAFGGVVEYRGEEDTEGYHELVR
jgi:hypothetical protein